MLCGNSEREHEVAYSRFLFMFGMDLRVRS